MGFPEGIKAGWAAQKSCGETVRHDEGGESSGGQVVCMWEVEGPCCCGFCLPAKRDEQVQFSAHLAENWRWLEFTEHPDFCPKSPATPQLWQNCHFGSVSEQELKLTILEFVPNGQKYYLTALPFTALMF